MRILIADDNAPVRRAVRQLLSTQGDWEICGEASSGPEAVEMVQELRPDLLLLDVSMPVLNGLETARLVRQENPQIKIVIFSQHDAILLLPNALQAGADTCLDKAQLGSDLIGAIRSL